MRRAMPATALLLSLLSAPGMAFADDAAATRMARWPVGPERRLVERHCNACHDLAWIERSGGDARGWTDRLQRMIRNGASLPRGDIPALAAYLARAFPERLRPQRGGMSLTGP